MYYKYKTLGNNLYNKELTQFSYKIYNISFYFQEQTCKSQSYEIKLFNHVKMNTIFYQIKLLK